VTPIDEPGRTLMFRALMTIVALEPVLIVVILMFVGVPWWMIAAILVAGVLFTVGVFALISLTLWRPWQRRYPARPILDGAVSQSWQSFTFGSLARLNNCITIIADEKHLHLMPLAPMRWTGARTISLPLDRISDVRPGWTPGVMRASLDGRAISGPDWCLRLANAGAGEAWSSRAGKP
jgi:hypothetical protein